MARKKVTSDREAYEKRVQQAEKAFSKKYKKKLKAFDKAWGKAAKLKDEDRAERETDRIDRASGKWINKALKPFAKKYKVTQNDLRVEIGEQNIYSEAYY